MATQTNCGGLMYDATTLEVNANKELAVKDGVVSMPIATDSTLGGVIPDGDIITVSETGAITVPIATETTLGVVSVDGDIITITEGGAITVADASKTVKGVTVQAEVSAVPETFADETAIQTYLDELVTALVTAGIVVIAE